MASLHNLLVDEPPSSDINNANMGINSVRNLLAVHDMAVAMCGGAHLANLKAYPHKFLSFLTQRIDPDSRSVALPSRKANLQIARFGARSVRSVI